MTTTPINDGGVLQGAALRDIATALAFLGSLPITADGIAKHLHERGITGEPCAAHDCPVATFVAPHILAEITVGPSTIMIRDDEWEFEFDTPPSIHAFIVGFDSGFFPFLYPSKVES